MDVVFPAGDDYDPEPGECGVRSPPFPFYERIWIGAPCIPGTVDDANVVHARVPFGLGLARLQLARRHDIPLMVTYHTPTGEYAECPSSIGAIGHDIERIIERYEWWSFDRAGAVTVPSKDAERHLVDEVGVEAGIVALSDGINVERSEPVEDDDFHHCYDLGNGPLIGYTGRHDCEKRLDELVQTTANLDATFVFGGDDFTRDELLALADDLGVGARFLDFLGRGELPTFYSALDVSCFSSLIETQGLVALEANACGIPVVGAGEGALEDTVFDGVTGYHYGSGDLDGFRREVRRVLAERKEFSARCLDRRDEASVDRPVDRLTVLYGRLASE